MGLAVWHRHDHLVAAVAGARQGWLVGDLGRGAVDHVGVVAGDGEQVGVLVADGEGIQQQATGGVRDLGLAWAATCRQLTVTLIDGTSHTAKFKFTK
ncbi:MAG: hypothetical protein ACRDKY_03280 [Solirubrobacteraceae bacterium]